jgi:Amt family ammonium transporter
VVHSVGGWAALAGAIVLGPRLGKYGKDGKPRAIMGHNMPLAALGVFILWLGWFGFNPGSTTTADTSIAMIFVNTNLAAAAGAALALFTSWIKFGKPEVGMSLNGALAGLVGITAGCANVTPTSAIIIGAVSVHGVCGVWGTLGAGLFNIGGATTKIILVQLLGIGACFVWTFGAAYLVFKIISMTIGLRVSPEEEIEGLDHTEHAGVAYPDFGLSTHGTSPAPSSMSPAMAAAAGIPVHEEG